VNEPTALERIRALLPPGSVRSSSPVVHDLYSLIVGSSGQTSRIRRYNLLYKGAALLARAMDLEEVLRALEQHLHGLVARRARRRLFVRAGVVGWGDSAVVLLREPSAQIDELVASLVRAGAVCYSDTYAVFDARGRVRSYRTRTFQENGTYERAPQPVEPSNRRNERRALVVRVVVVLREDPAPDRCVLSAGQAAIALMSHTIPGRTRPASMLDIIERAVRGATALALLVASIERAADYLLDYVDSSPGRRGLRRERRHICSHTLDETTC
jgi:hypothetical protein